MAKHCCDVDGCSRTRARWQRICERCYAFLPRRTSLALVAAYRAGDRPTWRARSKEAGQLLTNHLAVKTRRMPGRIRPPPHVTAQQAFANTQRLLGEQD